MGWLFNPFSPCCGPPPPCGEVCVDVYGCCGLPEADSVVTVKGPGPATTTVGSGAGPHFCVDMTTTGTYTIEVTAPGYLPYSRSIDYGCTDVVVVAQLLYDIPETLTLVDPMGNAITLDLIGVTFSVTGAPKPVYGGTHTYDTDGCVLTGTSCVSRGEGGSATVGYVYDHCARSLLCAVAAMRIFVGGYEEYKYYCVSDSVSGGVPASGPYNTCLGTDALSCTAEDWAFSLSQLASPDGPYGGDYDCTGLTMSGDLTSPYHVSCGSTLFAVDSPLECLVGGSHFEVHP
jgi:hypothetical protein